MSKAVHESKGSYTTCGRLSHACLTTSDVSEVTCLYCKSGGIGPHKAKLAYITATDGTAPVVKREENEIITKFVRLFKDQKPIPPDIQKIVNERFFEML